MIDRGNRMLETSFHEDDDRLGEIESQLLKHPQVEGAAVMAREVEGQTCVVAYIVPGEGSGGGAVLNAEALRMHLKAVLPGHVMPRALVLLESLPLTNDGVIDRQALPVPELDVQAADHYELPQGQTEESLAQIWQEVLQIDEIGRHTSFFDLGGHSLNALGMLHMVRERFGIELRINDVYQSPTLSQLAARIAQGETEDELVALADEAILDDDIQRCSGPRAASANSLLLTGATGFVGRFLLSHLLEHTEATIHCLVRAQSPDEAMTRLRAALAKWGLWRDDFARRVVAVPGRLGASRLGMADDMYRTLSMQVEAIYHCGASVNHLETYAMARAANVEGAKDLLRFATEQRPKLINDISTLAVFTSEAGGGHRVVDEASPIDHEQHLQSNGYEASKWVAEKLFMTAMERDIPCNIFRLGLVGPDAQGRYDEQQREYRILKSCLLSGYGIAGYRHEVPLVPVDHAVQSVVHLAGAHAGGGGIFHICGSGSDMDDLFERCNDVGGLALAPKPWFEWIAEIKRLHDQGRSLPAVPLVDFAFALDEQAFREQHRRLEHRRTSFGCEQTQRELERAKIPPRAFDDAALRTLIKTMCSSDPELRRPT